MLCRRFRVKLVEDRVKWPKISPRWPQEGPKRAQDDDTMAQDRAGYAKVWLRRPNAKNMQNLKEMQVFEGLRAIGGGPNEAKMAPRRVKLG